MLLPPTNTRFLALAIAFSSLPVVLHDLVAGKVPTAMVAAGVGVGALMIAVQSRRERALTWAGPSLVVGLLVAGVLNLIFPGGAAPWLLLAAVMALITLRPLGAGTVILLSGIALAAAPLVESWNGLSPATALDPTKDLALFAALTAFAAVLTSAVSKAVEARREEVEFLRRAEHEAHLASRAKDQLLANVSHEIRTPMGGVVGLADLLLREELTPRVRERIEVIDASAEALLVVIDDLLDFSSLNAGRLNLDPVEIRLRELTEKTSTLLRPRATDKGIELRLEMADDLPEVVEGDPARLRQVLTNLIGNAIKFTDRGFVEVRMSVEPAADGSAELSCTVRDTGIGIAEKDHASLFEPFTQADSSSARRHGGTGLGLSISRHLVELMGGHLDFESVRHEGSTFWFRIPLVVVAQPSAPLAVMDSQEPGVKARHRILVVDDNPVNRLVALEHLLYLGCNADAVESGDAALERLAEETYDVVLMDCQLPGLDGYETTRRLRRREDGGPRLTIIAVTAHAMKGERERCLAAGMDDYLPKPFRSDELAQTLGRWLGEVPR